MISFWFQSRILFRRWRSFRAGFYGLAAFNDPSTLQMTWDWHRFTVQRISTTKREARVALFLLFWMVLKHSFTFRSAYFIIHDHRRRKVRETIWKKKDFLNSISALRHFMDSRSAAFSHSLKPREVSREHKQFPKQAFELTSVHCFHETAFRKGFEIVSTI